MEPVQKIWFLYMVRTRQGHLYTGIALDVARRFAEHQSGSARSARYLRGKGPLTLVYQLAVGEHGDALRAELAIKRLSRVQKERVLLQGITQAHPEQVWNALISA